MIASGLPPVRRHLQIRAGQRKEIIASRVYDQLPVLISEPGQLGGQTYSQAQAVWAVKTTPQADGRVFPFTVEQFVLMGRYPYLSAFSTISPEDRRAVTEALECTGTSEFADRPLDTLSGGERQKVYIAAALAQGADVLLLDEPTTFLDYHHQAEIRDLLAQVNKQSGVTIVAVTHDVNWAAIDSHRVVALRDGAVAFCGPAAQIMDAAVLETVYDTPFLLVDHPQTAMPMVVPHVPLEGRP